MTRTYRFETTVPLIVTLTVDEAGAAIASVIVDDETDIDARRSILRDLADLADITGDEYHHVDDPDELADWPAIEAALEGDWPAWSVGQ